MKSLFFVFLYPSHHIVRRRIVSCKSLPSYSHSPTRLIGLNEHAIFLFIYGVSVIMGADMLENKRRTRERRVNERDNPWGSLMRPRNEGEVLRGGYTRAEEDDGPQEHPQKQD